MKNLNVSPSKEDFLNLESYNNLPIFCKIYEDKHTPIGIFEKLKKLSPTFLLESAGEHRDESRYSYIGIDTEDVTCQYENLEDLSTKKSSDLTYLNILPPFYDGYIGYVSYENVQKTYNISGYFVDHYHQILQCKSVIIMDHYFNHLFIVYNAPVKSSAYDQGLKRIQEILLYLNHQVHINDLIIPGGCRLSSNMTKDDFLNKVNNIKAYIKAGDVFQVVLSQCFSAYVPKLDPFLLYKSVRRQNPSAYLSYINFKDRQVICSSPEILIKCSHGRVESAPIAGTRPLKNDGKDDLRARELLNDSKERAEHTMLVDLGRNDLNKISMPGSQNVISFCKVKKYAKVMHLVSELEGELSKDYTSLNAMISVSPAGTVSGAPKKRALEIIHELEPTPRDVYAGSIFYLNTDGTLKSCIAIRTIQIKNNYLSLQTGAGIVYDSNPEDEYKETLNKAKALFTAIENIYEGGITYDFSH
jgi:anthranilate synthase component 1